MKKIVVVLLLVALVLVSLSSGTYVNTSKSKEPRNDVRRYKYGSITVTEFEHKGHVYMMVKGQTMSSASVLHSMSCPCLQ